MEGLAITTGSGVRLAINHHRVLSWGFYLGKAIVSFRTRKREREPDAFEGCLQTLHSILMKGESQGMELRLTVHVPDKDEKFMQLVDYVGESRARTAPAAGRKFSTKCGVIGKAYRTTNTTIFHRTDDDWSEFAKYLKENFGYDDKEVEKLDPRMYSFMAIPLFRDNDGKKVEAIVYLDTNGKNFFSDDRIEIAGCACAGIARFMRKRYAL